MALPKVNVNVQEETLLTNNSIIPFVPAVLIKTKSGPIGTIETITSESQFRTLFGDSDYTVPSAYAIQVYLRSYAYVLVTRLANENEAAIGTATLAATIPPEQEGGDPTILNLITVATDYKTDMFNGKEIKLVYDGTNHKLWIDLSAITGKNTISIKEDFTADTDKAPKLEEVLDKLVASVNSAKLGFKLTNVYTNKIETDLVPPVAVFTAGITTNIASGNSGNTTDLDTSKVNEMIDMYDLPDRDLDVMVIPEYTSYEVVNHMTALALKNNFMAIVAAHKTTTESIETVVSNYNTDNRGSLALYYPDVRYRGFVNNSGNPVNIPISMAVLHAYAKNDISAKWGAPAGVNRGNLTLVNELAETISEDEISFLYDAPVPVNCLNNISGKGFIVWGNKTATSTSEFFDRINVSRLVKYVTKQVYNISWNYIFEPISDAIYADWTLKVEAVLNDIKESYGIEAYQVIMDDSINTPETIAANQLNGIIRIKPQEVAEYINIDFHITDTIEVTVE